MNLSPTSIPIRFDPYLLDALVLAIRERPGMLPCEAALAAHATAVEHVYRRTSGDARRRALDRVNAQLVRPLNLADRFAEVLAEAPALAGRIKGAVLGTATGEDQRIDVHGPDAAGSLTLVARLPLEVWLDPAATARVLRHELSHAQDMLEPAFAYVEHAAWPGRTYGQRQLSRQRFTAMWCASVDARLERDGRERLETRAGYLATVARLFALEPDGLPEELAAVTAGELPAHAALLELCGRSYGTVDVRASSGPCPLCGFPSTDWVGERDAPEPVARAIAREFPGWKPADGCCRRCLEGYESRIEQGGSR